MAKNQSTVVVAFTDYTTVFPPSSPTTLMPGSTTVITLTQYTTVFPSNPPMTSLSSTTHAGPSQDHTRGANTTTTHKVPASSHSSNQIQSTSSQTVSSSLVSHYSTLPSVSPTSTPCPSPASSSSLQVSLPAFVIPTLDTSDSSTSTVSSYSYSISAGVSASPSSTSNHGLPTGWPAPEQAVEKNYNNAIPILMILWLVFIALFFLGALIYLAWRFARGGCADCDIKTAETIHLKTRLAGQEKVTPAMVRQRESSVRLGLGRGQEVHVSPRDLEGDGVTFSLNDPGRGIHVKFHKDTRDSPRHTRNSPPPTHSDSCDHFELENAIPAVSHWSWDSVETDKGNGAGRASAQSANALFRSGLSMEENRALALAELERKSSTPKEESSDPIPFWKRALARINGKNPVGDENESSTGNFVAGPEYGSSSRGPLRTFSKPRPAPAPPVPIIPRVPTNPYAYNPRIGHFEDTGVSSSGRNSGSAVPKRYPGPTPQSEKSEFITVGLDDQDLYEDDAQRPVNTRYQFESGGYGEYPRTFRDV